MIIIRDYLYKVPENFPPEHKDVELLLKSTLSYAWMAGKRLLIPITYISLEFNAQCLANIKDFVGVSDNYLEKMKKWIHDNQVEGTKITHKDSYSLNLTTLGDLNVAQFFHGLVANFEFP